MRWTPQLALLAAASGLALEACGSGPTARPLGTLPSRIDTTAIRGYTRFLSSDRLAGRATGAPGADLAAHYIASICASLGLKPVSGTYLHPVPLEELSISAEGTELVVGGPGGRATFGTPEGFVVNAGWGSATSVAGPMVYAESSRDLLAPGAPALQGAVAVVGEMAGPADDDSLRARGALGLIQLSFDQGRYLAFARSRGSTRLQLADTSIRRSLAAALPSVVAGLDFSRRARVASGGARVAVLPDSVTARVAYQRRTVQSSNVLCVIEGSEPRTRDTAIAYTAHYDHLGIGLPDASGDSVYNGFSDNAAGVGMLLAIAQAFGPRPGPPPRHSILFLFFTGEEQGLLGSDFFLARPPWPSERIAAVINLDAGAPPARPWSWRIAGGDAKPLGRLAQDVAADHGWSATTSPATPNSDYYPFVRAGIPAVFIVPGSGPYQGLSVDSSQALRRRWDRYHQPGDEWFAEFPFAGVGRYAEFAYFIGRAVDEGRRDRRAVPPMM
jgi:hypothetical protein